MEVAGQWRRRWAGSAEVGKVYEGGGARRVARAVEVQSASAAGARVRVLRAAYHAAGTRTRPAETFLMHSSRRVIISNSRMMESPTFNSKPLEISSMPLELAPEPPGPVAYHVTEPDDVPEPPAGRASADAGSEVPGEDSTSIENGSVIDFDTKMNISKHANFLRKMSFDSDISDYKRAGGGARASPLLEPPAALSTLRYKSLLTGAGDNWHDRRKSYSFEDTSPRSDSALHDNDTLAMESSTDSGICKSTELVDVNPDEGHKDTFYEAREETFKDWLAKNRYNNQYKPYVKTHVVRLEDDSAEDRISLQSNGKVSITLPMNNQTDDTFQYTKTHVHSETDRRTKRVEFCKTELHFAADSGRVNIIATDEKPPPTNNFRKRRSAFVPMRGTFDKPITLFGDKISEINDTVEIEELPDSENEENDENTAATKSILKIKIPKPKPYLLGENMAFGEENNEIIDNRYKEYTIPTTVSMINKQLQPDETKYDFGVTPSAFVVRSDTGASRIKSKDSSMKEEREDYFKRMTAERDSFREKFKRFNDNVIEPRNTVAVKEKLRNLQSSPILQRKPKTRQLREHELTFFGINGKNQQANKPFQQQDRRLSSDEVLHSVELIKKVNSNSIGNSDAESNDAPEYQNLPLKYNFAPIPIPKARTKFNDVSYDDPPTDDRGLKVTIKKPVILQDSRRTRQKDTSPAFKSRSISEPPKHRREWQTDDGRDPASDRNLQAKKVTKRDTDNVSIQIIPVEPSKRNSKMIDDTHIYANIRNPRETKEMHREHRKERGDTFSKTHLVFTSKPDSENIVVEPPCIKKRVEPLTNHTVPSEKHTASESKAKEADAPKDINEIEHKHEARAKSRKHKNSNETTRTTSERRDPRDPAAERPNEDKLRSKSSRRPSKDRSKPEHAGLVADRTHSIDRSTRDEHTSNKKRRQRSESKEKAAADKTFKEKHTKKYTTETSNGVIQEKNNRKEYVINYDDKNGTVSSICKVKPGANKIPDTKTNSNVKSKSPERKKKSHLPQMYDGRKANGLSRDGRAPSGRLQRTCEIL